MGKFKKAKNENKKNNENNEKDNSNISIYRNKEERIAAVKPIIEKLNELQLTIEYDAIKELFTLIQEYINEGKQISVNIAFPMINKRIKGMLCDNIKEEVWVKLEHEKY